MLPAGLTAGYTHGRLEMNRWFDVVEPDDHYCGAWRTVNFDYLSETPENPHITTRVRLYVLEPLSKPTENSYSHLCCRAQSGILAGLPESDPDDSIRVKQLRLVSRRDVEVLPSDKPVWRLIADVNHLALYDAGLIPAAMKLSEKTAGPEQLRYVFTTMQLEALTTENFDYNRIELKFVIDYLTPGIDRIPLTLTTGHPMGEWVESDDVLRFDLASVRNEMVALLKAGARFALARGFEYFTRTSRYAEPSEGRTAEYVISSRTQESPETGDEDSAAEPSSFGGMQAAERPARKASHGRSHYFREVSSFPKIAPLAARYSSERLGSATPPGAQTLEK